MSLLLVLFVVAFSCIAPTESLVSSLHQPHFCARTRQCTLQSSSSRLWSSVGPDEEDAERLKESATKLRQEVEELELQLRQGKRKKGDVAVESQEPPPKYTSLQDSHWKMTYRFASEPPPSKEEKEDTCPRLYYSGSVVLKFRQDGYTDLISHEPTGRGARIMVEKFWGWDEEISSEDGLRYVSWSSNVMLPKEDPHIPGQTTRFYFQAQVVVDDSNSSISLSDGTVTVKQSVKPPGGFWGIFNAEGILARFRYVGNFVQKATSAPAN